MFPVGIGLHLGTSRGWVAGLVFGCLWHMHIMYVLAFWFGLLAFGDGFIEEYLGGLVCWVFICGGWSFHLVRASVLKQGIVLFGFGVWFLGRLPSFDILVLFWLGESVRSWS